MDLPQPLVTAVIERRVNRFACWVEVGGRRELAHLPNSGRLHEMIFPGAMALVVDKAAPGRKTPYELVLVSLGGLLVSVDARRPSDLVEEALLAQSLAPLRGYSKVKREVTFGNKRLDFLLQDGKLCYLEVKSVTLVLGGRALFPDAPTLRGREHLQALMRAKEQGHEAAVAFVVQRADANVFSPNDATDPAFGHLLRQANRHGVGVYAFGCRVNLQEMVIDCQLPVEL